MHARAQRTDCEDDGWVGTIGNVPHSRILIKEQPQACKSSKDSLYMEPPPNSHVTSVFLPFHENRRYRNSVFLQFSTYPSEHIFSVSCRYDWRGSLRSSCASPLFVGLRSRIRMKYSSTPSVGAFQAYLAISAQLNPGIDLFATSEDTGFFIWHVTAEEATPQGRDVSVQCLSSLIQCGGVTYESATRFWAVVQ